jgi:HEPN domain-containing protein
MLTTESGFGERVYFEAAQERIEEARLLFEQGRYVLASYMAGVAVECLFHAYRMRAGAEDMARHDLRQYAELGRFFDGMPRTQRDALTALLSVVVERWQNNHRYRSAPAMRDYVIRNRLHVTAGRSTTRRDVVEYNAEVLLGAAEEIVRVGVERWG